MGRFVVVLVLIALGIQAVRVLFPDFSVADWGAGVVREAGGGRSAGRGEPSAAEMEAFAAAVQPGEIVMYSTQWCGYCAEAREWFQEYGVVYEECDIEARSICEAMHRRWGGVGVPFFVVTQGEESTTIRGLSKREMLALFASRSKKQGPGDAALDWLSKQFSGEKAE